MPKKQPALADIKQRLQQLDAKLGQYDRDFPRDPTSIDFYNMSDEELAAHTAARASETDINAPLPWEDGPAGGTVGAHRDAPAEGPGDEIVGATGGRPYDATEEGPGHRPGNLFFQNEIETESKPAPKPRRKRGQKTKEGQVIASRNSIKHGIMSNAPVVDNFETIEDWQLHRDGIVESITPQGP